MKNVLYGALAIFFIAIGMVWFKDATATEKPTLYIGVTTERPARLVVCDTKEQMQAVYDAGIKIGQTGWHMTLQMLNQMRNHEGEPVCGIVTAYVTIKELIDSGTTPDGEDMKFVRVVLTGGAQPMEYYSVLVGIGVEEDTACVNCI